VSTHQTDRDRDGDREWEYGPDGGWHEFTAARERFFASLAAQSASWTAARRLPERVDERYARAPSGQGEEARSR
jgi:hypothetical protein